MTDPDSALQGHCFSMKKAKKLLFGFAGAVSLMLIWVIASTAVHSNLILPSPAEVLRSIRATGVSQALARAVSGTLFRVLEAFSLSLILGALTGILSGLNKAIEYFLSPFLTTIRATPVLALILVLMFWMPSSQVPVISAVLMAYPVMHTSISTGIRLTDRDLLEMSQLFRVPKMQQFFLLRLPSALGHFLSGVKNSLGLCWKVVVAGEVISQPQRALGTKLQEARLSLETPEVFAWVVITILLCGLSEYLLSLASRHFSAGPWSIHHEPI